MNHVVPFSPLRDDADLVPLRAALAEIAARRPYTDRPRIAALRRPIDRALRLPVELAAIGMTLRSHGRAVRAAYGVSLARQLALLVAAWNRGIPPTEFYVFRLYRRERWRCVERHLGFSSVLSLQHSLIEAYAAEDSPRLLNKDRFYAHCRAAGLPSLSVVAEFVDGKATAPGVALPAVDLFGKPADLMTALGAHMWRCEAPGRYRDAISGEVFDAPGLLARLCRMSLASPVDGQPRRFLLLRRLVNHRAMLGRLTLGGLCTVRLVTCRAPDGGIEFLPPVLRMAAGGGIVDNVVRGGIAAPLDLASGVICGPAYTKDARLGVVFFDRHPSTRHALQGVALPHWQEVLALGRRAHEAFPSLCFIGWDIAILESGPVLVEGNARWDCDLTLVAHDLMLADTRFVGDFAHHYRMRPGARSGGTGRPRAVGGGQARPLRTAG